MSLTLVPDQICCGRDDTLGNLPMADSKRPFLMTRSILVDRPGSDWLYDDSEQLSVQQTPLGPRPVALTESARTSSKTMQEPGDDDPDPDAEQCY